MDPTDEIINRVDKDGNTVLHLADASKKHQVIDFLSRDTKGNVAAVNTSEHTAEDISTSLLCSSKSDENMDIHGEHEVVVNIDHGLPDSVKMIKSSELESYKRDLVLFASMKTGIIVLCSLLAIFCLDAILNPPGQFAPDDYYYFNIFICADAVCFLASLITIPLTMLATSFDSFYWRAVNVTAGMMIGSAVLLYASVFGLITNSKQVATWTAKIGLIMIMMLILLFVSIKPITMAGVIKRTSKMQR